MKMARRPGVLRMISPPRAFSAGYGSFGGGAGWAGPSLTMRHLHKSKLNVRNRSGSSYPSNAKTVGPKGNQRVQKREAAVRLSPSIMRLGYRQIWQQPSAPRSIV